MRDLGLTLEPAVSPVTARLAGEEAARARALVVEHFDFIWRILRRLGVHDAEVDDAAQQVFMVATRRIAEIRPGGERPFLYGTALRAAATLRRGAQRRQRWIENEPGDAASPDPTPDEELERRQALGFLDRVLAGLTDELREVFVLCEIEELSAPDVAVIVGIPVGTVASRLRRARRVFQERIQHLREQAERNA